MKKILLFVCFPLLSMSFTCDDDHDRHPWHPCTTEARAGLHVEVTLDGDPINSPAGILVTARDGNYIEDLETFGPPYHFSGAWERAGNYTITVTKEGYQDFVSGNVRVQHDECHVIARQLTIDLVPNP